MLWNKFFHLTSIQKFPIRLQWTLRSLHFKIHAMQLKAEDFSLKDIY